MLETERHIIKLAPWISYQVFDNSVLIGMHKPFSFKNKYYLLKDTAYLLWKKLVEHENKSYEEYIEHVVNSLSPDFKCEADIIKKDIIEFVNIFFYNAYST